MRPIKSHLCFLFLNSNVTSNWPRQIEQGMTQRKNQHRAALSASTSENSEKQVCEYCFQLVPLRLLGLGFRD